MNYEDVGSIEREMELHDVTLLGRICVCSFENFSKLYFIYHLPARILKWKMIQLAHRYRCAAAEL